MDRKIISFRKEVQANRIESINSIKKRHTTAGYSPCRKSRHYRKMNSNIKDVTL